MAGPACKSQITCVVVDTSRRNGSDFASEARTITAAIRFGGAGNSVESLWITRSEIERKTSRYFGNDVSELNQSRKDLAKELAATFWDIIYRKIEGPIIEDMAAKGSAKEADFAAAIQKLADSGNIYAKIFLRLGAETALEQRFETDDIGIETLQKIILSKIGIQEAFGCMLFDVGQVPLFVRLSVLEAQFHADHMTSY